MSMRVVYKLGDYGDSMSLHKLDEAVEMFTNRYQVIPDTVEMHHSDFKTLFSAIMHHDWFIYGEKAGDITMRCYLGMLKVKLRLSPEELTLANSEDRYIIIENAEANKVDGILLGDDKSNS